MNPLRRVSGQIASRLPRSLRFRLHDAGFAQRLAGRVAVDPSQPSPDAADRAQARWRQASPRLDLTWNEPLSGKPFIGKVVEYGRPDETTRLLEIGPGYGRLIGAIVEDDVPFAAYTGLDLSSENVAHLAQRFADPRITFMQGEVSSAEIPEFDLGYSSLTFKHFYPTFEAALRNCAGSLSNGGRMVFDLIEGKRTYFEHDDTTYVHCYERPEVEQIVSSAGLRLVGFDEVVHGPGQSRLLVIAER